MLSNSKKCRVILRRISTTAGALGQSRIYTPIGFYYALVRPLDAKAQAAYQQLGSVVTHEVVFSGVVDISLGENDILWGAKKLSLVTPPKVMSGNTIVGVCE